MDDEGYIPCPDCGYEGDAELHPRHVDEAEQRRRQIWSEVLDGLVVHVDVEPEPWQLELAAWILAREYEWSITGRGDIWVHAHTTASELAKLMQSDGRLNEWGNWPDDDPRVRERYPWNARTSHSAKPPALPSSASESGEVPE